MRHAHLLCTDCANEPLVASNRVGLGDYLERVGLLKDFSAVQEFIRGFVNSKYPFYMMDTGDAKESADEQIHRALAH